MAINISAVIYMGEKAWHSQSVLLLSHSIINGDTQIQGL